MPQLEMDKLLESKLRMLVYGEPGVGKTTLCGSALDVEEMCPILWVEVDGGILTLRNKILHHQENIDIISMEGQEDVELLQKVLFEETPYKTVVLDSITEFYWFLMQNQQRRSGTYGSFPEGIDYRMLSTKMLDLLRGVKDSGKTHFLVTAAANVSEEKISGALHHAIALPGQLPDLIPAFFHIIGYMTVDLRVRSDGEVRRTERKLQVQPFGRANAKTRVAWSKLGAVIQQPSLREIYQDFISTDYDGEDAQEQVVPIEPNEEENEGAQE